MDIFGIDKEYRLSKYKQVPLLFSIIENSTCTVEGLLSNVSHTEEEFTPILECEGDIVAIDSNFGHKKLESYYNAPKIRKSNRGRKKKEKPKSNRKFQGDGSSFNSQISFTVLGIVIRKKPLMPDKHSAKAVIFTEDKVIYEKFTKEYKIKIFRNGKFTVPGVLTEDLSDVRAPLTKLSYYFSDLFIENVEIINLFSVMRNYKFHLLNEKIDVKKLQKYCVEHFQNLLNTRFEDIEEFIINPIFKNIDISPNTMGWWEFLNDSSIDNKKINLDLSLDEFQEYLQDSKSTKNLFIDFNKLKNKIIGIPLEEIYNKIKVFVTITQNNYFIKFHNSIIKNIIKYMSKNELKSLEKFFLKSKDNLLSYIKYDPEKYPGFLIKVKTPNMNENDKRTTIKIFPSGKINIDGANNRSEAEFIYYWLNNLFYENKFIYNVNDLDLYNSYDSEFSSESE